MSMDAILIMLGWIVTTILLVLFVPKDKIRHAQLIICFAQVITWLLGALVAQYNLIEYPSRSFPNATKANFDFEYFIYPSFTAIFSLHYPGSKKPFSQFMYYFYWCSGLTIIEVIVERNTNIIKYINWAWYLTWISFYITFYIARKYYVWFFKLKENNQKDTLKP